MPSVDFTAWATPNLEVTLAGHDYSAKPPSVAQAKVILAFAVIAEHGLDLVKGEPDPELVALTKAQKVPLAAVSLGQDVYDQMIADGIDQATTDRVGYYAMHFWARGKAQADWLAQAMWATPDTEEVTAATPKAPQDRRSKSGRNTASASRTRTASTRTTGSRKS